MPAERATQEQQACIKFFQEADHAKMRQVRLRPIERSARYNTLRILPLVARELAGLAVTKLRRQPSCKKCFKIETLGNQLRIKIMIGGATGVIIKRKHAFDWTAQESDIDARSRDKTM